MKKQTFNTSPLDDLVNESIANADKLQSELQNINNNNLNFLEESTEINDDFLIENEKPFSEKKDLINNLSGDSVSYLYVYKKIGDLIDLGNSSLQMLQSIDPDVTDPATLAATGTLINSIRGCISEFTKIHQQFIRFQQTIKLEKIKLDNKKELLKYRRDMNTGQLDKENQASELFEVKQSDIVEFLQWKKEKEEAEKIKNEKI